MQITAKGKKTFYLYRYDSVTKSPLQRAIGTFPDVSIEFARSTAIRWLVELAEGRLTGKKDIPRLSEAAATYIQNRESKLSSNTITSYYSMLNNHLADWKNKSLDVVSRQDVVTRFMKLSERSTSTANRVFRFLRAIYNEQTDFLNDEINGRINLTNPVMILTKRKYWHKEEPASDWIQPDKLALFFNILTDMRTFGEFYSLVADYFEFLIFTGLRRRSASNLLIDDVDLDNLTYLIVPKGKSLVQMPLTHSIAQLLERRILLSKAIGSKYVFANPENLGNPINDPRRALRYLRKELSLDITIHGFRRSFATYAEFIDLSQYVIKRLLNHTMGRDVTAVHYIQRDINRLRAALTKIESYIRSTQNIKIQPNISSVSEESANSFNIKLLKATNF